MGLQITENKTNIVPYQSGSGAPTHLSPLGSVYVDNITGTAYINKDGLSNWAYFYDSTTSITGATNTFITGGTAMSDGFQLINNNASHITVTGMSEAILYTTTLSPTLSSIGIGGISGGTTVATLKNNTIVSILDKMLFPTSYPTFINPSMSLSYSCPSLIEVTTATTTTNNTLTANFNRGAININGIQQNYRSGAATGFTFYGQSIHGTITTGSYQYTYTLTAQTGYMYFYSTTNYSTGPQPYDSSGTAYGSPLSGGTVTASNAIEGVYPLYGTISSITSMDKQQLYSMITSNNIQMTLAAESGGNKQSFWIPTAWPRTLNIVNYFNTVSGSFDTTNKISDFVTSTVVINGINYYKYTNNTSNRGSLLIRLTF